MGLLGALVGGSIGFMLGGPLGAIILGALGSQVGDRPGFFGIPGPDTARGPYAGRGGRMGYGTGRATGYGVRTGRTAYSAVEAQQIFMIALISLAAKVAKADGRVTRAEIRSFDEFLRTNLGMSAEERRVAARIFNEARDSQTPAEEFARQIRGVMGPQTDRLRDLIALLLKIALADGRLGREEERLIRNVTLTMGLTSRDFDAALALFRRTSLDDAYRALEVAPGASDDEVKRAYRRLAKEYHPDTLNRKGVTDELREFAREKMLAVNDAYQRVKEARGF